MALTTAQKTAIEEIVNVLVAYTGPGRGRRRFAEMFMDLVNKEDYPEYYEVRLTQRHPWLKNNKSTGHTRSKMFQWNTRQPLQQHF